MTHPTLEPTPREEHDIADDVVARVLARAGTALDAGGTVHTQADGDQLDLVERSALKRVVGLSTELEDVTEVEATGREDPTCRLDLEVTAVQAHAHEPTLVLRRRLRREVVVVAHVELSCGSMTAVQRQ